MFYCNECADKNVWPKSVRISNGKCEICEKYAMCNDIPSSQLPKPETWEATNELRYWNDTHWHRSKPKLQQKWISSEGKEKWRFVPTVVEEVEQVKSDINDPTKPWNYRTTDERSCPHCGKCNMNYDTDGSYLNWECQTLP